MRQLTGMVVPGGSVQFQGALPASRVKTTSLGKSGVICTGGPTGQQVQPALTYKEGYKPIAASLRPC